MTALANRRRHRRRIAVAVVGAALATGLSVVGVLWTRSEAARRQANAEALRAEASNLLALGQAELERNPTAALAYATKSLELADTEEARRVALRVVQAGPTTFVTPKGGQEETSFVVAFSPDGEWFVQGGHNQAQLVRRDGRASIAVTGERPTRTMSAAYAFGPDSSLLVGNRSGDVRLWSLPAGREVRRLQQDEGPASMFMRGQGFFTSMTIAGREVVRWFPLTGGDSRLVGTMEAAGSKDIDAAGARMAYVPGALFSGRRLYVRSLESWATPPRLVGTHPAGIVDVAFHPDGRHVAAADLSGQVRIWSTDGGSGSPTRILDCPHVIDIVFSPRGRWLAGAGVADVWFAQLWDLRAPASAEPLRFPIPGIYVDGWAFDPSERWLAAANVGMWPVGVPWPRSVGRQDWLADDVVITPDGSTLVALSGGPYGGVRAWSLSPDGPTDGRILPQTPSLNSPNLAVDPKGGRVAVAGGAAGLVLVVPLAGGASREMKGFSVDATIYAVAFSPDGRRLAAAPFESPAAEKVIRVWDLESGASTVAGRLPGAGEADAGGVTTLSFLDDRRVVASSPSTGVLLFDLQGGEATVLSSRPALWLVAGRRTRTVFAVLQQPDEVVRLGLDGGAASTVFSCPRCFSVALDPTETVVAAGELTRAEGIVRIGPASGGEPHLFFGRPGASAQMVAFSPDGRWLASSGEQPGVPLWPVPDVTRTPLHKRSHEEVLATLRSWTNLRAVRDPQSPTGWKLEPGPFPGWAKLPQR